MEQDPPQRPRQHRHRLNPDPIRASPHSKLAGCGTHCSYRHLHHQRGTIGTFHVRLLEGRGLRRKHWSALSLGPAKHLGLSRAHGDVSSFGNFRLAFWRDGSYDDDCLVEEEEENGVNIDSGSKAGSVTDGDGKQQRTSCASSIPSTTVASSASSMTSSSTPSQKTNNAQHAAFVPSMPMAPMQQRPNSLDAGGKSPLTPLFDQGCIRTFSPARSPSSPSRDQQTCNQPRTTPSSSDSFNNDSDAKPSSMPTPPKLIRQKDPEMPAQSKPLSSTQQQHSFGPPPPHHYAKEQFKSSTVRNDSNPIWGDTQSFLDATRHTADSSSHNHENHSTFHIPLQKDDLLPALHADGGKISLEIRLEEEMAPTESLLVGGALSTAVRATAAATSVVGMGKQARDVSNMGMEMLGLGKDRLIGRGYVDLIPLLLGLWEETWGRRQEEKSDSSCVDGKEQAQDGGATLDEYGRINPTAHGGRRRVERMGMLDVWVPLYHPTTANSTNGHDDSNIIETSGKVHLLVSYEPNGIEPKRDDVVAFESFARRPLAHNHHHDGPKFSVNIGSVITPVVPPLSPLLVVETRGSYLLLEYVSSRTVTSVDRTGDVKSSRWERVHRVRVHRHAAFVIERRTLMDAAGNIARLPVDVVLSTSIGRELAEASAPIVAGAAELVGPALLWGRLMMAAGGTGARAGLAGARAATNAVLTASVEKALERRDGGGVYTERCGGGDDGGDAGVYSYSGY